MTSEWLGRGTRLNVRHRRDKILAALAEKDVPLTTDEVLRAVAVKVPARYGTRWDVSYSSIYADLRSLCGSNTMPYADQIGAVSAARYPVVWHTWDTEVGGRTVWTLAPEYRAELEETRRSLEDLFAT